ncbi:uncharacterized protein LOC143836042 [Paroedura picta]|uniref:uncharacterized protein LOC143836042 n=1 Tax=Paroedura picta TaxID=143630 RepID=UPI004056DF9D
MCPMNSTYYTKPFFWESIVISTVFSVLYLITLIMVYLKLRKIEKKISVHKAKRRPGLRTKKPINIQEAGKECNSQKMLASQPTHTPLWQRGKIQSQPAQHTNAQINNCPPKGNCSELSSQSEQHSDSDDVNYTTITFPVPKQDLHINRGKRAEKQFKLHV